MKTVIQLLKEHKLISEGIEDPGILKAVFLAGGPGSGKSAVAKELFNVPSKSTLSSFGLKIVNSDVPFEMLLAKYGLSTNLSDLSPEVRDKIMGPGPDSIRSRAKRVYDAQFSAYKKERLGMIVDGTGHDLSKISNIKKELENIGYDTFMVFVNTDLEVAQSRNLERKRKLPPEIVEQRWQTTQRNIGGFQSLFGPSKFAIVDNSQDTKNVIKSTTNDEGESEVVNKKARIEIDKSVVKNVASFIRSPIQNPIGRRWISDMEKVHGITADFHKTMHKKSSEPSNAQKAQNLFDPEDLV
jgi:predicted kinase